MQTTVKKALLLLSPSLVGVLGFYVLPVLAGGVFTLWSPAQGFLGLRPFASVATNAMFRLGVGNTALFVAVCVPVTLLCALGISFLIDRFRSASRWMQSLMLLPYILPTVVVIFVFRWIYDYNGVVNHVLSCFRGERVPWFSGAAMRLVILTLFVWKNTGFYVVILSARLSGTHKEQLEAAQLDGANFFHLFFSVYLPHLLPTIVFSVVMCTAQALDIFRECFLFSGNYPSQEIYTLQHFIYNCFHRGDYNSAVTALYALLPVIALMVWGLLREGSHEKS